MSRLKLSLLGSFQVFLDEEAVTGFESNKVRALLAYLAAERGRPQRREALADLLWPNWPEKSALRNLTFALADLRKNIADREAQPPFLIITREGLQLNRESEVWVDLWEFDSKLKDQGIRDREQEVRNVDLQSKIDNLQSVIGLCRGPFLEGFSLPDSAPLEEWLAVWREKIKRQLLQVLGDLAGCYEQQGEYEQALAYARRQVELEPWLEEAHQQLMRLLSLNGQRSAALVQYEICRKVLADELKVEPSSETKRLYEAIRDEDLQGMGEKVVGVPPISYPLTPAVLPPAPGEAPFKGLQYFDVSDADLFFGREALTARLVRHIREMATAGSDNTEGCCFLAVVGASGSGKSSVVRAGVIPALLRGEPLIDGTLPPEGSPGWHIHIFTPTAHPLEALSVGLTRETGSISDTTVLLNSMMQDPRSLRLYAQRLLAPLGPGLSGKCRLLLVVDQFEELFTLCRSEVERVAFLDNLLSAVQGGEIIQVVVVLRADFYGHCAQYPLLRQALCARQEYIGPMEVVEIRRAIVEPARRNGWEFEPGLVELILRDIGASEDHPPEPGALPLLEHALLETWQRRSGRTLTLPGYADAGGVHGAIAKTAENVFAQLSPDQQVFARRIFLRLTELGEGTQDTRRRAPLDELTPTPEDAPVVVSLLKILADARLITLAEDTAEVAHEALIREWPTLRQWLGEDREGLHLHRRLTESAKAWAELDRDKGELYRGARLVQAIEWAEKNPDELNVLEREFLQASQDEAEQEATEKEAQRQHELETARNMAEAAQKLAEAESARAEEQGRAARRLRQRALYLAGALLIALLMVGVAVYFGWRADRQAKINFARELGNASLSNLNVDPELSILLSLQSIATWSSIGQALPLDQEEILHQAVQASRVRLTWSAQGESVGYVGFNPENGQPWVVTGSPESGSSTIWNVQTGQKLASLPGFLTEMFSCVALSPDMKRAVLPGEANSVNIWEVSTGQVWRTLTGHKTPLVGAAYSPDGQLLVSFSSSEFILWELETGKKLWEAPSPAMYSNAIFSPDSQAVVMNIPSADNAVMMANALSGQSIFRVPYDPQNQAYTFAFSPDGTRLAMGGRSQEVQVWDIHANRLVLNITGLPSSNLNAIAFSPDGKQLAIDRSLVDAATGQVQFQLLGITGEIAHSAYNADGTRLITAGLDAMVRVWDLTPLHEVFAYGNLSDYIYSTAFSPDGKLLAMTATIKRKIYLWDTTTWQAVHVLETAHTDSVTDAVFSPDGKLLATAGTDKIVKVWDTSTWQLLHTLTGHTEDRPFALPSVRGVMGVAFSPDCKDSTTSVCPLASVGMDGRLIVWDARNGQTLLSYLHPQASLRRVAYSRDGKWIAVGDTGVDSNLHGEAIILDASTGAVQRTFTGYSGYVWGVAFSADGKRLATVGWGGPGKIWDVSTSKSLVDLKNFSGATAVAYSPNGKRLVTGNNVNFGLEVWDADSGLPLFMLSRQEVNPVFGLAFSPGGKYLAAGGIDGIFRVYVYNPEDLLELARSRLTRSWRLEECQKYLHRETCP